MNARRTKPRVRIALNFYLMTLASVISIAVFVACVFQTFVMGRAYQMTLTQGVANSFASKISELAYADDIMWRFQEERIAALFEHVKGESNTAVTNGQCRLKLPMGHPCFSAMLSLRSCKRRRIVI